MPQRRKRKRSNTDLRHQPPPDRMSQFGPDLKTPPTVPQMPGGMFLERSQFSGPLPPPDLLARYNESSPGAADRIITQMEEQGRHRRSLDKTVISAAIANERRGQYSALFLATLAIIGGFTLILTDHSTTSGVALIITPIISLVGLFIYSKEAGRRELKAKRSYVEDDEDEDDGEI